MSRIASITAVLILFIGGYNFALPEYGLGTPIQLVHGVYLNSALIIAYAFFVSLGAPVSQGLTRDSSARRYAALIACLGCAGIISAGVSPYSLLDVGQAMRLYVWSVFVLFVVHWSRARGQTFVLRWYLLGIAAGGVVNIYYSFIDPDLIIGVLPMLRARNGAGGLLGIAVVLGAWLMLLRRTPTDTAVAIAVSLIGASAAAMSFSKTALIIASCGIGAWCFALASTLTVRRLAILALAGITGIVGASTFVATSNKTKVYVASVERAIAIKISGAGLDSYSDNARYMYFWGVMDVLSKHPLAGVSYRGFYDAITHTPTYETGMMVEENPEAGLRGDSNPHNSFLYYAAANGVSGLILVCALFGIFLRTLWQSLVSRGWPGRGLWVCAAAAYFVYGMTLPTLFDTEVMYLPAAVAIALVVKERAARGSATVAAMSQVALGHSGVQA